MGSIVQPDVCFASVRQLASRIHGREISCREVMSACLAQIARLNPSLNAIVGKADDEQCLALADEADEQLRRGGRVGPLHGLPIAIKDLEAAAGLPHTDGSPIFKTNIASTDSPWVATLRALGVVVIGKTNVPEFGMGSHTYNRVYGTTLNPFDRTKTAGGSSGGAAVAVATGMLPFADGSDLGGSLRNPANFNNIVSLRPSLGRLPLDPRLPYREFSVKGFLTRTVDDLAFVWSALEHRPSSLDREYHDVRIAWCLDLGGLPIESRVRSLLDEHRRTFESLGCRVQDAVPPLRDVDDIFLALRRRRSWLTHGELLGDHRAEMKPEAVAEIEAGRALSADDVASAEARHDELLVRMEQFFDRYDLLVCAVNQVAPFDASLDWPRSVNGIAMQHYIAWMRSTYLISATWCPAISVPAGFTAEGLPVGLQIVGRRQHDSTVIQMAYAFEQATRVGDRRPEGAI